MTYQEISDLIDINLASGSKIPATDHRAVEHALLDFIQSSASQSGDIKRVKCDVTYLNDNFEVNGLGKNLRSGWAICNGQNGTDNLAGRVGVGYGIGYSALGTLAGEKEHSLSITELPTHNHEVRISDVTGVNVNTLVAVNGGSGGGTSSASGTGIVRTGDTGSGTAHNNMQPYIINLYIMKL